MKIWSSVAMWYESVVKFCITQPIYVCSQLVIIIRITFQIGSIDINIVFIYVRSFYSRNAIKMLLTLIIKRIKYDGRELEGYYYWLARNKSFESKMALEDYKDLVATSATISSSIQFLTGIAVCNAFLKKGSTGDATAATFVSSSKYG